jgi:hypothetical protein
MKNLKPRSKNLVKQAEIREKFLSNFKATVRIVVFIVVVIFLFLQIIWAEEGVYISSNDFNDPPFEELVTQMGQATAKYEDALSQNLQPAQLRNLEAQLDGMKNALQNYPIDNNAVVDNQNADYLKWQAINRYDEAREINDNRREALTGMSERMDAYSNSSFIREAQENGLSVIQDKQVYIDPETGEAAGYWKADITTNDWPSAIIDRFVPDNEQRNVTDFIVDSSGVTVLIKKEEQKINSQDIVFNQGVITPTTTTTEPYGFSPISREEFYNGAIAPQGVIIDTISGGGPYNLMPGGAYYNESPTPQATTTTTEPYNFVPITQDDFNRH